MFAATRQLVQRSLTQRNTRAFSSVKHVGVIGAGQMGTGIGIVASRVAGLNVTMIDPHSSSLDKSSTFVENWCAKEIAKERMTEAESRDVLNRI